MANHNVYTLSDTTATAITPNGAHSGIDITIQNLSSSEYVYVGGTDSVSSTSFGYRLLPNHAWSVELSGQDDLYLIASTAGVQAAVLQTGLEHGF